MGACHDHSWGHAMITVTGGAIGGVPWPCCGTMAWSWDHAGEKGLIAARPSGGHSMPGSLHHAVSSALWPSVHAEPGAAGLNLGLSLDPVCRWAPWARARARVRVGVKVRVRVKVCVGGHHDMSEQQGVQVSIKDMSGVH